MHSNPSNALTPPNLSMRNSASTPQLALDEHQLAIRWNLSVQTLRRWRHEQLGPTFCKLGRRITYLLDDIVAFERRVARHTRSICAGERHDD